MSRIPVIERDLPAVADWLDHFVAAAPGRNPIPILGSPGWIEAGDDIRIASLARYALGTLGELDPAVIAARLVAEIEAGRRDQAIITRQASKAISADWGNLARHPSHVEMVRRRASRRHRGVAGIPAAPPWSPSTIHYPPTWAKSGADATATRRGPRREPICVY